MKPETCGQTVLPDRLILIGQKLMKNAKVGFKKPWKNSVNYEKLGHWGH